jgi:hypothetical protein
MALTASRTARSRCLSLGSRFRGLGMPSSFSNSQLKNSPSLYVRFRLAFPRNLKIRFSPSDDEIPNQPSINQKTERTDEPERSATPGHKYKKSKDMSWEREASKIFPRKIDVGIGARIGPLCHSPGLSESAGSRGHCCFRKLVSLA